MKSKTIYSNIVIFLTCFSFCTASVFANIIAWREIKKLTASDAVESDYFGYSVAVAGDVAVIGAYGDKGGGDDAGIHVTVNKDGGSPPF